jgi:hypothetical protein
MSYKLLLYVMLSLWIVPQQSTEPRFGDDVIVLSTEKNNEDSELYVTLSPQGNFAVEEVSHVERIYNPEFTRWDHYYSATYLRDLRNNTQTVIPVQGRQYAFSGDEHFLAVLTYNSVQIFRVSEVVMIMDIPRPRNYSEVTVMMWATDRSVLLIKEGAEVFFCRCQHPKYQAAGFG